MKENDIFILGIESSCDETSAAVTCNGIILSNVVTGQEIHSRYGGVVPELASRAHQQQIIPVVDAALSDAKVPKTALSAIAFTRGPGLIGSLLVGTSFAKGMAISLDIPLIEVNHMQAHVIANFATRKNETAKTPSFPFLCLTVSGGHTQLVVVKSYLDMEIIGETLDDAAGEAFDKIAKMLELPYPGGPLIDKYAANGSDRAFKFPEPQIPGLDFSFSGLKTAVLYFLQKEQRSNPDFSKQRMNDICASVQAAIIKILLNKLKKAAEMTGINSIALAGGVSANSGLRRALQQTCDEKGWNLHLPELEFCTDNAGMIAVYAYHKFLKRQFCSTDVIPLARMGF